MILLRHIWLALLVVATSFHASAQDADHWRFDVEAAYSDLSHGLDPWREGAVRAAYTWERLTLAGAVEAASRFDSFDAYVESRGDYRFDGASSVYVFLGGTPSADFRPQVAVGAGGAQRLFQDDGIIAAAVATVDLRHARYAAGDVETANPGVEVYLARGLGWLTARHINIWDETGRHHTGFFVRADIQPVETLTLFAGYADAPDTSEGVVLQTTAWFAGIAADVDDTTTIRLSLGQELHETGYDRTTVTLSLTLKR